MQILQNSLFEAMNLVITDEGNIIDLDLNMLLSTKGKLFNVDEFNVMKTECLFNPLQDAKQMTIVFKHLLYKKGETEGYYYGAFYGAEDKEGVGTVTVIEDNIKIESRAYYSEVLRYMSLIYILTDYYHLDLSVYDVPPKKTKRGR